MRWMIVALALVAAILLWIAVSWPWWAIGSVFVIGPGQGVDQIGGSATFRQAAVGVNAGAMITAAMLIVLAAATASGRRAVLAAGATITAALTALVAGIVFVAAFPGLKGASVSRGMILFFASVAVALTCAVIAGRAAPGDRHRRRDRPL